MRKLTENLKKLGLGNEKKIHVLEIKITKEKLRKMTLKERDEFIDTIYDSMTPEQKMQMVAIGKRVVGDDLLQRAAGRSRTALRTMARAVNVTVNEAKEE